MSMYIENIIDLYKNPLNYGLIENASVSYRARSPVCGDDITVDIKISEDKIYDIKHRGNGCAISQAAMSMLSEKVIGMTIKRVLKIHKGEIIKMLGIEIGPVRLKCALLGLKATHRAIKEWEENKN